MLWILHLFYESAHVQVFPLTLLSGCSLLRRVCVLSAGLENVHWKNILFTPLKWLILEEMQPICKEEEIHWMWKQTKRPGESTGSSLPSIHSTSPEISWKEIMNIIWNENSKSRPIIIILPLIRHFCYQIPVVSVEKVFSAVMMHQSHGGPSEVSPSRRAGRHIHRSSVL